MLRDPKNTVDELLVKSFIKGDVKAFDEIYHQFNYKLYKFVLALIKSEVDTEDLVHEVFVKVWENRERLINPEAFDSYLFTIAYNATVSFLRKRAKNSAYIEYIKSVQVPIDESGLNEEINDEEINSKLNELIEQMPTRQREVFKLKHFENYSYKEIADQLNISVNTVENHMVKAHKFLKANLDKAYFAFLLFISLFF